MEPSTAKALLLVSMGGAAGSALRFLFSVWIKPASGFPWATLAVNLLGCFAIGLVYGFSAKQLPEQIRLLLATGFCGGFTTFSAFGHENLTLFQSQQYLLLGAYISASLIGGLLRSGWETRWLANEKPVLKYRKSGKIM